MLGNPNEAILKYAREGDLDGVKNCLKKRANVNFRSTEEHMVGMTPLQMACAFGQGHVVRFLLEKDETDLYNRSIGGWMPIHHAALSGNIEILKLLLIKNPALLEATINEDWTGCTPLHIAAVERQRAAIKYLIEKGANTNALNWLGHTPLEFGLSGYAKDRSYTLRLFMNAYCNGALFQPKETTTVETAVQTEEEIVAETVRENAGMQLHQNVGLACAVAFVGSALLYIAPAENDSLKIAGTLMIAFGIFVMTNKGGVAVNNIARSVDRFVGKIGDGAGDGLKKGLALVRGKATATVYAPMNGSVNAPVKVDAPMNVHASGKASLF